MQTNLFIFAEIMVYSIALALLFIILRRANAGIFILTSLFSFPAMFVIAELFSLYDRRHDRIYMGHANILGILLLFLAWVFCIAIIIFSLFRKKSD